MSALFADTSGWGNLVDPTQSFYSMTAEIYRTARKQSQKIVTTNYVVGELIALMTSPLHIPRQKTIAFVESLKTSPYVEVIHIE